MSESGPKSWIKETVLGVLISVVATVMVARFGLDKPTGSDPAENEPPATAGMAPRIVGKWEQSVSLDGISEWQSGGVYRVALHKGQLVMSVLDNDQVVAEFDNSRGLTDVVFDGREWSFNSHLETGEVLQFKLHQTNDDLYVGYAYHQGERLCANRWSRVRR